MYTYASLFQQISKIPRYGYEFRLVLLIRNYL